ncbi:MAG: hypothetical protein JW959_02695 [Pirellulales bacterium]|nr:hypothetical protein [Pirellulales bacterium]
MKPSRLEALAARQQLRDMVCIAMADGQLSAYERSEILLEAKQILYPDEYRAFQQALDRALPARKKSVAKRTAEKPRQKPPVKTNQEASQPEKPVSGLVIPAGAVLPMRTNSQTSARPDSALVMPAGAISPERMDNIIRVL